MFKQNTFVISLGGSLIVPNGGIDHAFLKKFRALILSQLKKGSKFYIVTGGGATCRHYIEAGKKITPLAPEDLDWLGIHSSRLNAHLIRTIFRKQAHPEIITHPNEKMKAKENIIIGAGWKPGWSTDYVATLIAENYGAKTVINLSNIDYAYDRDPKKHKDAKIITEISWQGFRKIVGNKWVPGMNAPFDPIASKEAEKLGLRVIITNGKNLANLKNILDGKKFVGTVIK